MAHFIWVSDFVVINLDQVVSIDFDWQIQYEQDGRRSYDPEAAGFDESLPMVEVKRRRVVDVDFAVAADYEYGKTLARKRFYADEADKIFEAVKHQASAW